MAVLNTLSVIMAELLSDLPGLAISKPVVACLEDKNFHWWGADGAEHIIPFAMAYGSLTGTPSIPAAQIPSDWNQANPVLLDFIKNKPTIPPSISYFTTGGAVTVTKVWASNSITPTTANNYAINVSSAGFTNILGASVIAIKSTTDPNQCPNVEIQSFTTVSGVITAVNVNIVSGNAATIVILGINVLSGAPLIFAPLTGLTLSAIFFGN